MEIVCCNVGFLIIDLVVVNYCVEFECFIFNFNFFFNMGVRINEFIKLGMYFKDLVEKYNFVVVVFN